MLLALMLNDSCDSKGLIVFSGVLSFLAEGAIYVALIIFYIFTMNDYNKMDMEALQFFVDKNCSEGPL